MENNLTPKGDDNGSAIAFGDFTYDQAGKFLSVYVSAFRALSVAFKIGGIAGAIKSQAKLMDSMVSAGDKLDGDAIKPAVAAIAHAMSSVITTCDPVDLAGFTNKALEATHKVFDEKPNVYQTSHIMFEASGAEGGVTLKVYAVPFEALDDTQDKLGKIVNINNNFAGNN